MSLEQVIGACTINPARVMGWEDRLGNLAPGGEADISVLQLSNEPVKLRDSVGGELVGTQQIVARWTVRRGEILSGKGAIKKEET
jgi:predicted amidohydrolase